MTGVQYVVREGEDTLSGTLVSKTCRGTNPCTETKYATGVGWEQSYYYLRVSVYDLYTILLGVYL